MCVTGNDIIILLFHLTKNKGGKMRVISLIGVFLILSGAIIWNACSKTGSSSLTITGTLATQASRNTRGEILAPSGKPYRIYCVTFAEPPSAGYGDVDSVTGKFSLTLDNAAGVAFGCFVLDASTSGIIATVAFEGTDKGMDGDTTREGTYIANNGGNLEFGTVTLDLTTGVAVVKKSDIQGSAVNAGVSDDFFPENYITGTWDLKCISKPELGYNCGPGRQGNGPPLSVYLHELKATDNYGNPHRGLAIWASEQFYTGCGSSEALTLPSGWTAVTPKLTDPISLDPFDQDFDSYSFHGFGPNGVGVCGVSGIKTCNQITANTANWGNGHGLTFNVDDCKALCAAQGVWEASTGTCPAYYEHNGDVIMNATNHVTCDASGCKFGADYFLKPVRPMKRFGIGELVIKGGSGSMHWEESEPLTACVRDPQHITDPCTEIQCKLTYVHEMNMMKTGENTAIVDVKMRSNVHEEGSTPSGYCSNTGLLDNWIAQEASHSEQFMMKATKR